jgi:flagellar basal body-associated protein FliL
MRRSRERGSARLQFLIVLVVIVTCAYAGYLYIPVAFKAHNYKDVMQHYADVAGASGYTAAWAGEQVVKIGPEYDVPLNAVVTPALRDQRVEIRVQFVRPIEFPGYTYNYEFDYTVKSTAFITIK